MRESNAIDSVLEMVKDEIVSAALKFPPMNSAHEGYAVLLEELDELWEHVKAKQFDRDIVAMQYEAIQVAAMAIRFAIDVCNETTGNR